MMRVHTWAWLQMSWEDNKIIQPSMDEECTTDSSHEEERQPPSDKPEKEWRSDYSTSLGEAQKIQSRQDFNESTSRDSSNTMSVQGTGCLPLNEDARHGAIPKSALEVMDTTASREGQKVQEARPVISGSIERQVKTSLSISDNGR